MHVAPRSSSKIRIYSRRLGFCEGCFAGIDIDAEDFQIVVESDTCVEVFLFLERAYQCVPVQRFTVRVLCKPLLLVKQYPLVGGVFQCVECFHACSASALIIPYWFWFCQVVGLCLCVVWGETPTPFFAVRSGCGVGVPVAGRAKCNAVGACPVARCFNDTRFGLGLSSGVVCFVIRNLMGVYRVLACGLFCLCSCFQCVVLLFGSRLHRFRFR